MEIEKIRSLINQDKDEIVEELLEDIKNQYGEVPYIVDFMKNIPDLFISRMIYTNSIMREFEHMDSRTVELISIAVASALKCDNCLKTHIRIAKRLGITKEEIFSAILISSTVADASIIAEGSRSLSAEFSEIEENKADDECFFCNINNNCDKEKLNKRTDGNSSN